MRVVMIVACVGVVAGASACRARQRAPATSQVRSNLSTGWRTTALASNAESTPVKEGAAPLVYLVEGGAMVRVRDVNANLDLARSFVAARSIVRVDARRGVIYGDDTLVPGPLAADHRYVIYVDPTGENVARQGTFQPRPHKAQ
jgi:hypothetical protein